MTLMLAELASAQTRLQASTTLLHPPLASGGPLSVREGQLDLKITISWKPQAG